MDFGMFRTLGFRHWFAWQLVRLAWHIYDDDTREEIALLNGDEEVAAWTIDGDCWGSGLSSQYIRPGFKYGLRYRQLDDDGNVLSEDNWGPR